MISGSRTGGSAGGLRGPQRTKLRRRLPRANDRQLRARVQGFNRPAILAVRGQTRHFERTPLTSGLPRLADILRVIRHVAKVPIAVMLAFGSTDHCRPDLFRQTNTGDSFFYHRSMPWASHGRHFSQMRTAQVRVQRADVISSVCRPGQVWVGPALQKQAT